MLGGGMGRWKIQRLLLRVLWTLNILQLLRAVNPTLREANDLPQVTQLGLEAKMPTPKPIFSLLSSPFNLKRAFPLAFKDCLLVMKENAMGIECLRHQHFPAQC